MFNLAVILRESATADPDKPLALSNGVPVTYGHMDAMSDSVAEGLVERGVQPGQAVGVQLPNVPEFLAAYFGILKAGAVAVPLNVLLKAPEVAFCLARVRARALITWGAGVSGGGQGCGRSGRARTLRRGYPDRGVRDPVPRADGSRTGP